MVDVFIIGSKGIPARYGGFETFVDHLTKGKKNIELRYHVACQSNNDNEYTYNGAKCFNIKIPNIGSSKAIVYDLLSLKKCIKYIKMHKPKYAIVYILACRIGPFIGYYKSILHKMGVKLYVNPDGHEWKRKKWSKPVRIYWKMSEKWMVKNSDLLICDSRGIEDYIHSTYQKYNPHTVYISYGSEVDYDLVNLNDLDIKSWLSRFHVRPRQYYLIVGRFVPENNYEFMIKEFMKSKTKKDLVIVSNVEKNKFYYKLIKGTNCNIDKRIKFVGTVYKQPLLKKIRKLAFCYLHGHEVGGTNPSLLEALATTPLNLLLDVVFNREVGQDGALYFEKISGNLSKLINNVDGLSEEYRRIMGEKGKKRILDNYSWDLIINRYESLFFESIINNN